MPLRFELVLFSTGVATTEGWGIGIVWLSSAAGAVSVGVATVAARVRVIGGDTLSTAVADRGVGVAVLGVWGVGVWRSDGGRGSWGRGLRSSSDASLRDDGVRVFVVSEFESVPSGDSFRAPFSPFLLIFLLLALLLFGWVANKVVRGVAFSDSE